MYLYHELFFLSVCRKNSELLHSTRLDFVFQIGGLSLVLFSAWFRTLPQRPFSFGSARPALLSVVLALALGCSGQSNRKEPDHVLPLAGTFCLSPRATFPIWSQLSKQACGPA